MYLASWDIALFIVQSQLQCAFLLTEPVMTAAIHIKADRIKAIKRKHPWIFF